MQFDHTEQINALAALPPEPKKPRERGLWATVWDATKAGAAETVATVGKVAKAYGAAQAAADEANPLVVAGVGREAAQRGAQQGRDIIARGEIETDIGRSFRNVANDMRPDPATAGFAENTVFALTRGLTKAVGSTIALGPAGGAAMFGASEADVTFEDLRAQGVDAATAGKVAAVTGIVGAGTVALPMAGQTLKATAGLYLAGGPGGFVAQQAATRAILERANYADIAKQYDPLDPVGLAVSALVPLPFAGFGAVRNIKTAKAAQKGAEAPPSADPAAAAAPTAAPESFAAPEAVDAAMVHNLTLLRDQQAAAPRVEVDTLVDTAPPPRSVPEEAAPSRAEPPAPPPRPAPEEASPDLGRLTDAYTQARTALDDFTASKGDDLGGFLIARGVPPEVNNLVVGLTDVAGNAGRLRGLVQQIKREAAAQFKSVADATADAVEGMRKLTYEQIAELETPKVKPASADPLMDSLIARVAELEQQAPDMVVRFDADDNPVTLRDEMERIRREAATGTDDVIGTDEADLLQVAAACAMEE